MDVNNLKVPVKNEKGENVLEDFNPSGNQSDGSRFFFPKKLVSDDHEHVFTKKKPEDRHIMCECGYGGDIFPHNSDFRDGHVYNLKGDRVA